MENEVITSAKVAEGAAQVGRSAFLGCSKLRTLDASQAAITTFGARGCYDCDALEAVQLPAGLLAVRESAFQNCGR